ncbi:hypothetical protein JCM3774_000677 [Rhodotorula dairenensis]
MLKPSQQSGGKWRHRHKLLYYASVGATSGFDIAFAALVIYNHFSLPAYVWVTCITISLLEAAAIILSAVLIKLHIGRRSHADMGTVMLPLWCGSLTINVAYLWGSYGEDLDSELYWRFTAALGVSSQIAGLVFVAMSYLYHVVSLRNDRSITPAASDEEAAHDRDEEAAHDRDGASTQNSDASDGSDSSKASKPSRRSRRRDSHHSGHHKRHSW